MIDTLEFPDGWQTSTSWQRAQQSDSAANPVSDKEWIVQIGSGDYHRVTFHIEAGTVQVGCDCEGYHWQGWCAHVAKIWWDWVRDRRVVTDVDTGKQHRMPPAWLSVGGYE